MLNSINVGDTVWDIGCNIGLYTGEFLTQVGGHGSVLAVDMNIDCIKKLRLNPKNQFVKFECAAISDKSGDAIFKKPNEEFDVTASINTAVQQAEGNDQGLLTVQMMTLNELYLRHHGMGCPAVIKIDVEGEELKVLTGMDELLDNPVLTAVCVEVHFSLLEKSGQLVNLDAVLKKLKKYNFVINWTDPSHFVAKRI